MSAVVDVVPADIPTYARSEVALYLSLPKSTVVAWTSGTTYGRHEEEKAFFFPVIIPATPQLLSFRNFVELYILKSLRREHDVPLANIREAISVLRRRTGSDHPLAERELLTDRKEIIIEEFGKFFNLNRNGQLEMGDLLQKALERVRFSGGEWTYRPVDSVVFSPSRQFGRPCIDGTRISTDLVFARYSNGETLDEISYDLDCDSSLLENAIEFEERLRAA